VPLSSTVIPWYIDLIISSASGNILKESTYSDIEPALIQMDNDLEDFLILEIENHHFMQVARTANGGYIIEYSLNPGKSLYRSNSENLPLNDVVNIFKSFSENSSHWKKIKWNSVLDRNEKIFEKEWMKPLTNLGYLIGILLMISVLGSYWRPDLVQELLGEYYSWESALYTVTMVSILFLPSSMDELNKIQDQPLLSTPNAVNTVIWVASTPILGIVSVLVYFDMLSV
jgi:hypothetical protein